MVHFKINIFYLIYLVLFNNVIPNDTQMSLILNRLYGTTGHQLYAERTDTKNNFVVKMFDPNHQDISNAIYFFYCCSQNQKTIMDSFHETQNSFKQTMKFLGQEQLDKLGVKF